MTWRSAASKALVADTPGAVSVRASPVAVAAHMAFAFGFLPVSLLAMSVRTAAVFCGAGGAWLVVSPWALGYGAITAAALGHTLLGAAFLSLSAGVARGGTVSLR
jgi:SPW repeat-containing protein